MQMAPSQPYLPDAALSPGSLKRRQQRRASRQRAKENDPLFKRKRADQEQARRDRARAKQQDAIVAATPPAGGMLPQPSLPSQLQQPLLLLPQPPPPSSLLPAFAPKLPYGLVPPPQLPPPPPLTPQPPSTPQTPQLPPTVHPSCTVGTQASATSLWVEELIDPEDLYDGPDDEGYIFRTDIFNICDEPRLKLNNNAGELANRLLNMLHGEEVMDEASDYQGAETRYTRDPQRLFLSMEQLPWFTNFLADMLVETKSEARMALDDERAERERAERAEAQLEFMKAESPGMFSYLESRFHASRRESSQ